MNKILRLLAPVFASSLAGIAFAVTGEVTVAVNWPGEVTDVNVIRINEDGQEVSVLVDRQDRSIKLVNFPDAWYFRVSPTSERRPSITVTYGSSLGRKRILVAGYSEGEKITEAVLESPGESAELMLMRVTIQLDEKP